MSTMPRNWASTTLGEIAVEPVEQRSPEAVTFTYVDISSIDKEKKRIVSPQQLETTAAPSRARQCLCADDVLVSMTRPNLNAVARVPKELGRSIGSTGFCVLRSSYVSSRWLEYRVQAHDFIEEMSGLVQGVLYPAVRPKDIFGFKTLLPPRQEQDRIADEIEKQFARLDDAVAALKRVQVNLKRYRTSVLKAACEGRLVPTEAELARKEGRDYQPASELLKRILAERRAKWEADQLQKMIAAGKPPKNDDWKNKYREPQPPNTASLPNLPEGWSWTTWDQISNWVTYGFTRPMSHVAEGIPIITAKNVKNGFIDVNNCHFTTAEAFDALSEKDRPRTGDILITKDGSIGRSAVVQTQAFCINQSVAVIWLRSCPLIREYLCYVIESEITQKPIWAKARGVAIQHLSITDFAKLAFPLPPIAEQRRIAEELTRQLSIAGHSEKTIIRKMGHALSLHRTILASAFTGKLIPQDPNDEPASVLVERIRAERATPKAQKKTAKATAGTSTTNGLRRQVWQAGQSRPSTLERIEKR